MNKKQLIFICAFLLFISISRFTFAVNRYCDVAGFDDQESVEKFADKFKHAVVNRDKDIVASMILFPAQAIFKDKTIIINTKEEFLKLYDTILDKDLINKISRANTHKMFCNYQGAMIGDGDVWFSKIDDSIKVTAVGVIRRYWSEEEENINLP